MFEIKSTKLAQWLSLLHASLRSSDPLVRAIGETLERETVFEREVKKIDSPNQVMRNVAITGVEKELEDYDGDFDIHVETDLRY